MERVEKVLLDTDIGTNIDDALCLVYLLRQPACELLGITTVTGEPEKRSMIARALCRAAGKDVPVFPGSASPLVLPARQRTAPQAAVLERGDRGERAPTGEAVEFLRQTLREHPGEVTLLAVGPLTNVARLFQADPGVPALLKGLVTMGGNFAGEALARSVPPERNVSSDPHAASIVFASALRMHAVLGLNVTREAAMDEQEFHRRFGAGERFALLRELARIFFQERKQAVFHDPLAAAAIFRPDLLRWRKGTVSVVCDGAGAGGTAVAPEGGRHRVAYGADIPAFFQHYFRVVGAGGSLPV